MLLMLVMRLMLVLVVLMVLEELVVFVGGIFKNNMSQLKKNKKFVESKKKIFGAKKNLKILKTKSKIHLYFRVVHSSIPPWIREEGGGGGQPMWIRIFICFGPF